MTLFIVIGSIFAIAGIAWLANKILPLRFRSGRAFRICPICAGVAGTWLWMLGGMFIGVLPASNFQLLTSILMGGSVVGIAYQIEKRLLAGYTMLFKLLFIPAGFIAVYSFLSYRWFVLVPAMVFLAIVAWGFLNGAGNDKNRKGKAVGELEKKMEDCC